MKRFIILVFFILFFAIYPTSQRSADASPTSEILCNGWLAATTGIDCIKGNCSPNPSPDSAKGHDIGTYTIADDVGVRAVSRDYFPTWGEREMFYRTSDDPLTMELIVKRQYCWARYAFFPSPANCGGPDWKWAFPLGYLSWSEGVNYAIWGDTVTKTFSLQSRGSDNAQTIFWGSNHAYIDYEKTADGKENPKRVCAYFSPVAFGKIVSSDDELIGCIDIPLNPAPDIYNKILIPKKSVIVAGKIPNGSTFMNPKINLQVIDSTGQNIGGYITLEHNYLNDSTKCSKKEDTMGDVYCPFILASDPTKICAGLQGESSSKIGCVDRPKPSGSIIINALHDYYIDNNCPDINNKPSMFHSLKIQLKDSTTNEVIKEFPENELGLRDYYACYQTGQNPKDKSIEKSILSGHDTINVYGVQFSAVIPKFIDNDRNDVKDYAKIGIKKIRPQNFKKTYMYPLITVDKTQLINQQSCDSCNCFVHVEDKGQCTDNTSTSKQRGENKCAVYNTPTGERERDSCVKNYSCYDLARHPLPMTAPMIDKSGTCPNCISYDFGSDLSKLNDAEKAYCSGVYKLNQDTGQNAICINLDTKWPDFFGAADQICAEIPASFMKLGKNDISYLTGYIDFTDDKFDPSKVYKEHETEDLLGKCDAELNLEKEKCLSNDGKICLTTPLPGVIKGLDKNEMISFKQQYTVINQYLYGDEKAADTAANTDLKGINANMQTIDKQLLRNLGYDLSKQEFPAINVPDGAPYRKVGDTSPEDNNFPIGIIYNGCRFVVGEDGCGKNTKTAPFLGNAIFDASNLNLNTGSKLTITKLNKITPQGDTNLIIKDIPVEGKCEDGLVTISGDAPLRMCRVIVDSENTIITKSWSDQVIINPCAKDDSGDNADG